nr:unnamed protein product [Digitaria exilis]
MGTTLRGTARVLEVVNLSVKSSCSADMPSGNLHSNACSSDASTCGTTRSAIGMPGHCLRPYPNGKNPKSFPLKSTSAALPKKRSGINSSGLVSHYCPHVDEHRATLGNCVSAHLDTVVHGLVRRQQRPHRVKPHGFLHHGMKVRQRHHVSLLNGLLASKGSADLRAKLGHGTRVAEQLGHRPLHCDGGRFASREEDLEHDGFHGVAVDLARGHEVEEHLEEVVVVVLAAAIPGGGVLGQPPLDDAIHDAEDLPQVPGRRAPQPLQVERLQEGEEVRDVGLGHQVGDVPHVLPYPVRRLAGGGVHVDDVDGEEGARHEVDQAAVQGPAEFHLLPGARADVAQQLPHLALADAARRGEAARREGVRGQDAALQLPERVRARQVEQRPIGPAEGAHGVDDVAPGEAPVVLGEGLHGGLTGGDGHGRDGPQLEAHHGAVRAGEAGERLVEIASKVEGVPDDRERPGSRREPSPRAMAAPEAGKEVEERDGGECCPEQPDLPPKS